MCNGAQVLIKRSSTKLSLFKLKVNKNSTLSTLSILVNDNHMLWPYNILMYKKALKRDCMYSIDMLFYKKGFQTLIYIYFKNFDIHSCSSPTDSF